MAPGDPPRGEPRGVYWSDNELSTRIIMEKDEEIKCLKEENEKLKAKLAEHHEHARVYTQDFIQSRCVDCGMIWFGGTDAESDERRVLP